jgi:glycosyltransferase involved in cell wall biosynthesis
MYLQKTIAVVVPAHNEETLIGKALGSIPPFVDRIIVVDDGSVDATPKILREMASADSRIMVRRHEVNRGVGGAIVTGYKQARELGMEVTAVMAGDAQMDPDDLVDIVTPVASGSADYAKGNRLFQGDAWAMIPHHRYLGNSFLSLLTKIASGYWHVADSQSGYTAASLTVLKRIDLDKIYAGYGMPNDFLIRLNEYDFRVRDVHVKPVYNIGEKSGIRLLRLIPRISWLLFKGFWRRLFFKYVIKDFHPLVFFYLLSFLLLSACVPLTVRLFYVWSVRQDIPDINAMALVFAAISGLQTLFFGMWFDMEYNKDLK